MDLPLADYALEAVERCTTVRELSKVGQDVIIARRNRLLTREEEARIVAAADARRAWIDEEAARLKAEYERLHG